MPIEGFWCKVRRFEKHTGLRIFKIHADEGLIIQKTIYDTKQRTLLSYAFKTTKQFYIWRRRGNDPRGFQINNFTARQRKHLKDLPQKLQEFQEMTLGPCTGCIYENEHILKGECDRVRENY